MHESLRAVPHAGQGVSRQNAESVGRMVAGRWSACYAAAARLAGALIVMAVGPVLLGGTFELADGGHVPRRPTSGAVYGDLSHGAVVAVRGGSGDPSPGRARAKRALRTAWQSVSQR